MTPLHLLLALAVPALADPPTASAPAEAELCDGPDYTFVTGGANLQPRYVPQFILTGSGGGDRAADTRATSGELSLRLEFGLSDDFELDVVGGRGFESIKVGAGPIETAVGFTGSMIGIRWQALREKDHGVAMAIGPQVLLPTGDRSRTLTPSARAGYALDFAIAKDLGRIFLHGSANWARLSEVSEDGNEYDFDEVTYAAALGVKAFERRATSGNFHDVHIYWEAVGNHTGQFFPANPNGQRIDPEDAWVAVPGARYGVKTPEDRLFEIGVGVPIGLNPAADDWGVVVQLQYEHPF